MPAKDSPGGKKAVKALHRGKGGTQKPYHLSGLAKFFMILGAITFPLFTILTLVGAYLPAQQESALGRSRVTAEYPLEVRMSAVIFLLQALVFTTLVIAALAINSRSELRLAERVHKLTSVTEAIIWLLVVFMITCVAVALWTAGEVIFLPGGGTLVLIFVLRSEIKNWRTGHELTVKRKFKKAREKDSIAQYEKAPGTGTDESKSPLFTTKPALARLRRKKGLNIKVLLAIGAVAAVLVLLYFLFGTSNMNHPAYIYARNEVLWYPKVRSAFGVDGFFNLKEGGITKWKEGEEFGWPVVEFENTIEGSSNSGTFSAKMAFYKQEWRVVSLKATVTGGETIILRDRKLTKNGIERRQR